LLANYVIVVGDRPVMSVKCVSQSQSSTFGYIAVDSSQRGGQLVTSKQTSKHQSRTAAAV